MGLCLKGDALTMDIKNMAKSFPSFLYVLLVGVIAALPFSSARAEAPVVITVDPAETRGVWEGWGTSLAW